MPGKNFGGHFLGLFTRKNFSAILFFPDLFFPGGNAFICILREPTSRG